MDTNSIKDISIVLNSEVLQTFATEEKFCHVLASVYAFYFLLKLPYPASHELLLGFFHEVLFEQHSIQFEKKRSRTYISFLDTLLQRLKQ
jgi:hypothetical protein